MQLAVAELTPELVGARNSVPVGGDSACEVLSGSMIMMSPVWEVSTWYQFRALYRVGFSLFSRPWGHGAGVQAQHARRQSLIMELSITVNACC